MAIQLGSVLLDACVLAVVMREDTYGYKLTQEVKQIMDVSESTLYPVLRRLQKDGYLRTYDKTFQGRNRRYYTVTEKGREQFQQFYDQWKRMRVKIDEVMDGGIAKRPERNILRSFARGFLICQRRSGSRR